MKAVPLYPDAPQARNAAAMLLVQADGEFLSRLTLGQIIKGRVLRVYEPNRALMRFEGGGEHVVDSAVPLRQDEVVRGRVVGLGERVEVRRLAGEPGAAESDDAAAEAGDVPVLPELPGRVGRLVAEVFQRYRGALDAESAKALLAVASRHADPGASAMAGLVLAKLGLPVAPELLRVLQEILSRSTPGAFAAARDALQLESTRRPVPGEPPAAGAASAELGRALAQVVSPAADAPGASAPDRASPGASVAYRALPPGSDSDERGTAGDGRGRDEQDWVRRVLSAQTGGSIAHRVGTLHVVADGRLIELDLALFEQQDDGPQDESEGALRHRRVALAFDAGALGVVEATATLTGDRVGVRLATADTRATQFLSSYANALTADLEEIGLHVDELAYATRDPAATNAAVASAVEHIVSAGSVSRLA